MAVVMIILEFLAFFLVSASSKEVYIVYSGDHGGLQPEEVIDMHHSMLASVKKSVDEARESLLYSYKHGFNGFAAHLSSEEASVISEMEGVISVFPSKRRRMHTTRSWRFLGISDGKHEADGPSSSSLWKRANYGQDTIVGLLDSGIWPECESFKDDGMPPIPSTWRGFCEGGDAFNSSHCNKKLIGARYYLKGYEASYGPLNVTATPDYRSPRDKSGHGTHTSSIAVGREVRNASSLGGYASGKAVGGAPMARLAMYKVCWPVLGDNPFSDTTCTDADMLAAIDDALYDGVHVLSISIGGNVPLEGYIDDAITLGSLHAVKLGVIVACSVGNDGPSTATATNLAPWIITVAASSVDRSFPSHILLGDGTKLIGQTVTSYNLENKFYPLVFSAKATFSTMENLNFSAGQCLPGSLNPERVKGKIVFCLRGTTSRAEKGLEVKRAGGAAVILGNLPSNGAEISVDNNVLPGTAVVSDDTTTILAYINSAINPIAHIDPARTVLGTKPAPFMAAFSSRGPNVLDPNILKPDITAPGLNILAAWSGAVSPTQLVADERRVKYNIISGTSMACPHVAGIAALLKAMHPDWSPAAIRSALMTTAVVTDNEGCPMTDASGNPATPFGYGSGHVNPNNASDPGLLYDATTDDYLLFLCSSGIDVSKALNTTFTCPDDPPSTNELNHPSIVITNLSDRETVTRTVTNVGGESEYFVSIENPPGVSVHIHPRKLCFQSTGQKHDFTVTFILKESLNQEYVFGSYTWDDGIHKVRSPIAVSAM
ncbi:hypothetical protein SUGI_0703190 [Cryptomeria japonica]|uniref:subtilisin-like protease SBT5.6 n=1 Tax=Cryptomeria japonica TaxID=3369 RepID=UPI00241472B5|nr:subtilisin-like protease SBT5.6 [Cryptomeria japonica]GLJ34946.1 hypothetical protein SUGI_0703190 [Cryptomeria japonica]